MRDGTPLPLALSGDVKERVIRCDDTLFYLVGGALNYLANREQFEETGTLTESDARQALNAMLTDFYNLEAVMIPIGATMMWHTAVAPSKWLFLKGGAISKTTYPELFDIFGYTYGGGFDIFVLPTMNDYLPIGAGGSVNLGDTGGSNFVNLTQAMLPNISFDVDDPGHAHSVNDPGHFHRIQKASATVNAAVNTSTPNARSDNPATPDMRTDSATTGVTVASTTTGISVHSGGAGDPVPIRPAVRAVNYIIYAGH